MRIKLKYFLIVIPSILIYFQGCGGSSVYVREDEVTQTYEYSDTDLKLLAEKMVMSMLESGSINNHPKIWVSDIQNRTGEYIDTKGILEKISVALLKSGKVRLVDREALDRLTQEKALMDFKRIDINDPVQVGQILGADLVLVGNLMSIEHKDKGLFREDKMIYYKFTMRLVGMNSEIYWMDEKELKKSTSKDEFF